MFIYLQCFCRIVFRPVTLTDISSHDTLYQWSHYIETHTYQAMIHCINGVITLKRIHIKLRYTVSMESLQKNVTYQATIHCINEMLTYQAMIHRINGVIADKQ